MILNIKSQQIIKYNFLKLWNKYNANSIKVGSGFITSNFEVSFALHTNLAKFLNILYKLYVLDGKLN